MKNVLEHATAAVMIGLLTYSLSLNVRAEETTSTMAAPDTRILDREGKPIYGAELMTESEISGLKSMLSRSRIRKLAKRLGQRIAKRWTREQSSVVSKSKNNVHG